MPGRTGLLAPAGDAAGWAEALRRAYAGPEEMLGMGREARRVAAAELTPERHLEQLLAVYERARA